VMSLVNIPWRVPNVQIDFERRSHRRLGGVNGRQEDEEQTLCPSLGDRRLHNFRKRLLFLLRFLVIETLAQFWTSVPGRPVLSEAIARSTALTTTIPAHAEN
jgi:hypothetical protein